jgi:hypothetical protein
MCILLSLSSGKKFFIRTAVHDLPDYYTFACILRNGWHNTIPSAPNNNNNTIPIAVGEEAVDPLSAIQVCRRVRFQFEEGEEGGLVHAKGMLKARHPCTYVLSTALKEGGYVLLKVGFSGVSVCLFNKASDCVTVQAGPKTGSVMSPTLLQCVSSRRGGTVNFREGVYKLCDRSNQFLHGFIENICILWDSLPDLFQFHFIRSRRCMKCSVQRFRSTDL